MKKKHRVSPYAIFRSQGSRCIFRDLQIYLQMRNGRCYTRLQSLPTAVLMYILKLDHATPMAGHLGVNKTYQCVLNYFYWLGIEKDVKQFCKSCEKCQVVRKT